MKKLLVGAGVFLGAWLGTLLAFGAGIPSLPSTAPFNDPSQVVATLNTLIQSLQGQINAITPAVGNYGLGSFCTNAAAGATPQTCNGQRGNVAFTGLGPTTTGTVNTVVVNNAQITAASSCYAQWITPFTAGAGVVTTTQVAGAGTLTVISVNAGTTANAVTTGTLAFACFN